VAITTLDGVIAGFQAPRVFSKASSPTMLAGRWYSTWSQAGVPGAGVYDTTLNGVTLSSTSAMVNGQIPHVDPGSGNAYLARFALFAPQHGVYLLCDRLWHNGGLSATSTSAQSITSPPWPARDLNGGTNGHGVFLAVEISATTGTGTPTITIDYTNSAGTASRTGTNTWPTISNTQPPMMFPISLQDGDNGVRSVQSLTLSATWVSGTMNIVAYRPLARLDIPNAAGVASVSFLSEGLPRLYNGVVPYAMHMGVQTIATTMIGVYAEVHG